MLRKNSTSSPKIIQKRKKNNSHERSNSVSDITHFFQTQIQDQMASGTRKQSGRKDKEKEKELREVRENIRAMIENDSPFDHDKANANGGLKPNKEINDGGLKATSAVNSSIENNNSQEQDSILKSLTTVATQTTEDEILSAIKELAANYNKVESDLYDPKNGISAQLAKTQNKVQELYTEIHGAVSGLKVRMDKVVETATSNENKIANMQKSQSRITELLDENKRLISELKVMQGLVEKVSQKSDTNAHQIMDLTRRGMEQNLILHGVDNSIEVEDPKQETPMYSFRERPKYSAIQFFSEVLKVDISVEDIWKAHRMGPYKTDKVRPLIVKLAYSAKELVMEHMASLKGKSNNKTKQTYFISEQIPEGIVESRKQINQRLKTLKDQNEAKPKEERSKIQVINEKILVNDVLDLPEVTVPKPSQLFLDERTQALIDQIQSELQETSPVTVRNSEFMGISIKVSSIEKVQQAYIAVTQRYPSVDHIMLGYAFRDSGGKLKTGFCDDREYGSGVRIRKTIFKLKCRDTAVFVLRKFGGVHLGFNRFKTIEEVAQTAIGLQLE